MFGEIGYIIGQVLSVVAVITGVISFQMKTARGILCFQITTALVFSAHYFLIGAFTAMALNLVSVVMCACYYFRNKREKKSLFEPIFFMVLLMITSVFTWDGWYSVFIMAGLVLNAVCLSLSEPQKTRKLILIKAPLCLIYNILVISTGGMIYESATLISSIVGIIRNSKKKAFNGE